MSDSRIKRAWRRAPVSMFLSTCAGIGHLPGGPGTYAAIVALPLIVLVGEATPFWMHLVALLIVTMLSFLWCEWAGRALEEEDSSAIVLDEFLGVWWTLVAFQNPSHVELVVGLVAFRIFDIAKPWPVGWADRKVKGGLGVMLDDLLAAGWAALVVLGVRLVWG